jgi:hypothetical protein
LDTLFLFLFLPCSVTENMDSLLAMEGKSSRWLEATTKEALKAAGG